MTADDSALLLAEVGLTDEDFRSNVLAVYRSDVTRRIAVIVRSPLTGTPLRGNPANLHTTLDGEGTRTYFFNPLRDQ